MEKLQGLHGLRGAAALAVVLFHQSHMARDSFPGFWQYVTEPLYLSVQLFFVLSAFSLCFAQANRPTTLTQYALRRFLRLAPLFWLIAAFQVWRSDGVDFKTFLLNVTLLFNIAPGYESSLVWGGWSVGVEAIFYVLFPLFWLVSSVRGAVFAITITTLMLSTWFWSHTISNPTYPAHYAYFSVIGNLPQFMFGILAFKLFRHRQQVTLENRQDAVIANFLACALLAFLIFDPFLLHGRTPAIFFAGWGLMFAIVVFSQAIAPAKLIRTRWLQWVADRSYGIYLFHPMVIEFSKPIYANITARFSSETVMAFGISFTYTLTITFLLAHTTFVLLERPIYRLASWKKNAAPE